MKVCPRCGFEDALCWHTYRWITDIDYAPFGEFVQEYLELKDIHIGEIREYKGNYYRRSGKRNHGTFVFRRPTVLGRDYYKMRDFEHYKKPLLNQKQLESSLPKLSVVCCSEEAKP